MKKQTMAEKFEINEKIYAVRINYYDIEENGAKAGTSKDYKSLASAYKFCGKEIWKGYAMSLSILTMDGWQEVCCCQCLKNSACRWRIRTAGIGKEKQAVKGKKDRPQRLQQKGCNMSQTEAQKKAKAAYIERIKAAGSYKSVGLEC